MDLHWKSKDYEAQAALVKKINFWEPRITLLWEATCMDFFRRIREGYCQIKNQNSNHYRLINGEQSPENVFKEIKEIVMKKFEEVMTYS